MNFQAWAAKSGIPWRAIKPHLADVMDRARSLWPSALKNLPMNEDRKAQIVGQQSFVSCLVRGLSHYQQTGVMPEVSSGSGVGQ